jgi:hypothetical protein
MAIGPSIGGALGTEPNIPMEAASDRFEARIVAVDLKA